MTIRRTASIGVLVAMSIATTFSFGKPSLVKSVTVQAAQKQAVSFQNEPTDRAPETYQGSFFYTTSQEMLNALNVRVFPEDKVYAFPEPALGMGSQIKVYRAQPVLIKDGTLEKLIRTWAPTVGEFLKEQEIEIGAKDVVQPATSTSIQPQASPFVLTITRVAESQITLTQSIDFSTQYKDDNTLEKGTQKVTQIGSEGVLSKAYLVHQENGVEISRRLVDQSVTKAPVAEIITRGTKIIDYGSGGASWYGGVGSLTAAHRTLPLGTKVRVVNVATGASVVVTIADRGPFVGGRIIDLSKDAFAQIASVNAGVAQVRLEKVY